MEYKFTQTKMGIDSKYTLEYNNKAIYFGSVEYSDQLAMRIYTKDALVYSLIYMQSSVEKKEIEKQLVYPLNIFKLTNNIDEILGFASLSRNKIFFGYSYFQIVCGDIVYTGYEIGLGKKGLFLCIYINDMQVALFERNNIIVNNLDTYTVNTNQHENLELIFLLGIYYDYLQKRNTANIKYSKTQYILSSTNKELLSKYDSNFINSIT